MTREMKEIIEKKNIEYDKQKLQLVKSAFQTKKIRQIIITSGQLNKAWKG